MKEIENLTIDGEDVDLKQYVKQADFEALKEKVDNLIDGDEVAYGSE